MDEQFDRFEGKLDRHFFCVMCLLILKIMLVVVDHSYR